MKKPQLILITLCLLPLSILTQNTTNLSWWKPKDSKFPTIDGQYWTSEMNDSLFRLPPRAEALVRKPVWNLAKNSAGLFVRFVTTAGQITVRYKVSGNVAMNHMPATGVSGVDLYGKGSDGQWHYCTGRFVFRDTVSYTFDKLKPLDATEKEGREYCLYLPLYNTVRDLEIGVPIGTSFTALPKMGEKPIVVYGTSIAQGGCASRPAMAWTNIVARKLNRPVYNLAFSGNGQLETPLIDFINEIEAKVYVLDCLPNMIAPRFDKKELQKRLIEAVKNMRAKHPTTPILLTEHAGYTDGYLIPDRQTAFEDANKHLREVFEQLKAEQIPHIFTLKKEEIGLDMDAMVDGTHPNDLGMMQYAEAYAKKLQEILDDSKIVSKTHQVTLVKSENIFKKAPFAECHASSLVELSKGKIMATWFAGTEESNPDVTIWLSTYENGRWSDPLSIADGIINEKLRYPCWNPVLFKTKEGKLFLFYKVGKNPREWWGEMKVSNDDGKTWSKAEKLPEGFLGPIKNKPIQLANGDILHPSSTESLDAKTWHIHLEKSDKNGKNWQKILVNNGEYGIIQPTILRHSKDKLQVLNRSRQNKIIQSWSNDNGKTWQPVSETNLPNPNAGVDGVTLKNGWQVLVYNPMIREKGKINGREKLAVALSKDGINWEDVYILEDEQDGEFSYPAIVQSADGLVHITYTWNRFNIKYVVLKVE